MEDFATLTSPSLLLLCAASLLLLLLIGRLRSHGGRRLPPGPPALPFLAKFLLLRRSIFDLGPLLVDLHERYGPVISIRLFHRTYVFVTDRALVQGGATFAGRPPPHDPGRLFNAAGRDISASPYGAYWRILRRNLASEALSPARVASFAAARRSACDGLVSGLLQEAAAAAGAGSTVALRPLLRRAMFAILVRMCFGLELRPEELDEVEDLQRRALSALTEFPVFSFFPALTKRLFHRQWAKLLAVRRRKDEVTFGIALVDPIGDALIHANRDSEGAPFCYAESLLDVRVEDGQRLTDAEMVSLCSEFLNGGTDTTVTLLEWIMAELVNRPEVQAKLQQELQSRPPEELNSGDLQSMPYLKAVVFEGLRLHPPGSFVLPHGVQQQLSPSAGAEIGGYTVPKGAAVNFLVAEIGRDEATWTAAREFRPERFLPGGEGHGVDVTGSMEIKMMPFGAGRRACPGYALGIHHAEYFVARMVGELLWLPETEGKSVDMAEKVDFTTVMKHPLRARVVPRS